MADEVTQPDDESKPLYLPGPLVNQTPLAPRPVAPPSTGTPPIISAPAPPAAPLPVSSSPASLPVPGPSATIPQPAQGELAKLWASERNIHNPFLRILARTGTGIGRAAEGVATGAFPRLMESIPGTQLNADVQNARTANAEAAQAKEAEEGAQGAAAASNAASNRQNAATRAQEAQTAASIAPSTIKKNETEANKPPEETPAQKQQASISDALAREGYNVTFGDNGQIAWVSPIPGWVKPTVPPKDDAIDDMIGGKPAQNAQGQWVFQGRTFPNEAAAKKAYGAAYEVQKRAEQPQSYAGVITGLHGTDRVDDATTKYTDFAAQSKNLEQVIQQGMDGNQVSNSLASMGGALMVTSSAGVHRINTTEIGAFAGKNGLSWANEINTFLDKGVKGKVPDNIVKDWQNIVQAYRDNTYKAYITHAKVIAKNNGLSPSQVDVSTEDGTDTISLDQAGKQTPKSSRPSFKEWQKEQGNQ